MTKVMTSLLTSLLIFLAIELMEDLAMRRDPSEFRARFNAYKNGKSVSELYDSGLPTYAGGKPDAYSDTVDFLKQHEGFKDTTYLDGNGVPTIGYGFTDSTLVGKGKITKAAADDRLRQEIISRDRFLSRLKNWDKLNEGSKTALRSYYYNYPAGFKDTTKFMKAWNAGNYAEAIRQVDAGMNDPKNRGLRTRRLAEQALLKADPFLMPTIKAPEVKLDPIVNVPISTAVRQTIPAEQTTARWAGAENASPYITGRPMIQLQPKVKLPTIKETIEQTTWKPGFEDGKSPQEWADDWKERLQSSAKSKVLQKWNATGQKPQPESPEQYTQRRIKETTWKKPSGRKMLEILPKSVDFIPGAGDVKQGLEALKSATDGDYTQAALFGAGMTIPTMFRGVGKKAIKKIFGAYDSSNISRTATLASIATLGGIPGAYDIATGEDGLDSLYGSAKMLTGMGLGWFGGQKLINYLEPKILKKYYGIHRPNKMPEVTQNSITSDALFDEPWYTKEDRVKAAQSLVRHNYNKLQSGDSYALISDDALSSDSAPLYFAQLARHSKLGKINTVTDDLGNITMARLNNYGGYRNINDINRSIDLLNQVYPGIPYAQTTGKQIYVPQVYITKYKDGKFPCYKNGKIYIKPSKRGSFTAAAKRRGMTVSQLESAVLKNPSKYSKAMRKKAQFSRNARSWSK